MKKRNIIISSLCLCLFGCAEAQINVNEPSSVNMAEEQDVYIAQASLSDTEKDLLDLINSNQKITIWDYHVDDSVKTIAVNIFSLNDQGEWEELNVSAGSAEEDKQGRMAILLDDLDKEQEIVFLHTEINEAAGEKHSWKTSIKGAYFADSAFEGGLHGYDVSDALTTEKVADQDIPLIMLYGSKENVLTSPNFSDFENPEELAQMNYDYCYVITIEFSTLPIEEYIK